MTIEEIAKSTLDEATAYYMNGAKYKHKYFNNEEKVYTCHRYIEKNANGEDQEAVKFSSDDGYNLFCDPEKLGTMLPDVASDGLEIIRI